MYTPSTDIENTISKGERRVGEGVRREKGEGEGKEGGEGGK